MCNELGLNNFVKEEKDCMGEEGEEWLNYLMIELLNG